MFETPVPDVVRGSWNRIALTNYKPAVMVWLTGFDLKGLPFPPDPGADSSRPGEALSLSFLQTCFCLFLPFFRSYGVGGQFSITVVRLLFSCPSHFFFLFFSPFCLLFLICCFPLLAGGLWSVNKAMGMSSATFSLEIGLSATKSFVP